jgi:hypothetical protein
MKYSLRSLFVVVTLAAVVSGFVARSRYFAERAAFHRKHLPSKDSLRGIPTREQLKRFNMLTPSGFAELERIEKLERYHEVSAIAYERASKMPFLPISLPADPQLSTP